MASLRIAHFVTNDNIFLCLKALLDPYLEEQGRFWLRLFFVQQAEATVGEEWSISRRIEVVGQDTYCSCTERKGKSHV
jgi:hypothetical protein